MSLWVLRQHWEACVLSEVRSCHTVHWTAASAKYRMYIHICVKHRYINRGNDILLCYA